ncbi:MAG: GMC family oxidoreductase [Planctomycetes bacterium]|nr:GMC family oxidoreductase [Planctomycetota bacterium]
MDHYDIILIGTGAGGGTLLHKLAPSGKRILVLERGEFLPREKDNWDPSAVFLANKYKTSEEWLDKHDKPFHPGTHYWVGGNTKVYGAALLRFRERDFEAMTHVDGVSPAWPLRYADFEPYYTEAEWLYQVRGQRGEDPTEPWASKPYPCPPIAHEPRIQKLHDDFAACGLQPFHLPLGVRLTETNRAFSPCIRCATCDGFPCLLHAKADAEVTCVRPALQQGNVTLRTGAFVRKILTNASGTAVTGVEVERDGRIERYRGDFVIAAAGAVNSAALLLRSATDRHPHGLANRSGVVGRNYMCHVNSVLLAISRHQNPTVFQKTIALNDFYFGERDWQHPMGHISMVGKSDRAVLKAGAPAFAPGLVLDKMARHALDFWLTSEDLPDPENRVTLAEDGRIRLSYAPNNTKAHDRLIARLKSLLGKLGCEEQHFWEQNLYLGKKIPLAGVAHQCGTVRFGDDPATSALDPDCKAHDLDNLYVVDASFFVSSAAVNPGLTIMANALRVGDHLLQRLGLPRMAMVEVPV